MLPSNDSPLIRHDLKVVLVVTAETSLWNEIWLHFTQVLGIPDFFQAESENLRGTTRWLQINKEIISENLRIFRNGNVIFHEFILKR